MTTTENSKQMEENRRTITGKTIENHRKSMDINENSKKINGKSEEIKGNQ